MSMADRDYLELARFFGTHSTCRRLSVGAVLVKDKRIISTGYNGAPAGLVHCTHDDITPCDRAVHAEANCIAFAAKVGIATGDSVLYSTHTPCISCAQLIINSGIRKVVYGEAYRKTEGEELLEEAGIPVSQVDQPEVRIVSVAQGDGVSVYPCYACGETKFDGYPHSCRGSARSDRGTDGKVFLGPSRTVSEVLAERDRDGSG